MIYHLKQRDLSNDYILLLGFGKCVKAYVNQASIADLLKHCWIKEDQSSRVRIMHRVQVKANTSY